MNDDIFKAMAQSIIDGESEEAAELAQKSIEQDIDPLDAINKGFILGVNTSVINSVWKRFLPELVMAGEDEICNRGLEPELTGAGTSARLANLIANC